MKIGRAPVLVLVRLLGLAMAGLSLLPAHADEYGDVNQLVSSGQLTQARERVERHLASKPRDPQMRYFLGLIQRASGQPAEALDTFTKLSEDFPELPEPYNGAAVIHAGNGDYDKARAALEAAIRAHPGYATAHENLGDVYLRLAAQSYCKAQQLDPGNSTTGSKLTALSIPCPQ